jgi:hypothetical protein
VATHHSLEKSKRKHSQGFNSRELSAPRRFQWGREGYTSTFTICLCQKQHFLKFMAFSTLTFPIPLTVTELELPASDVKSFLKKLQWCQELRFMGPILVYLQLKFLCPPILCVANRPHKILVLFMGFCFFPVGAICVLQTLYFVKLRSLYIYEFWVSIWNLLIFWNYWI